MKTETIELTPVSDIEFTTAAPVVADIETPAKNPKTGKAWGKAKQAELMTKAEQDKINTMVERVSLGFGLAKADTDKLDDASKERIRNARTARNEKFKKASTSEQHGILAELHKMGITQMRGVSFRPTKDGAAATIRVQTPVTTRASLAERLKEAEAEKEELLQKLKALKG